MAKPKVNFQDILLKKGEYIALGAAGLGLGLLLVWGVTRGLGSEDPDKVGKALTDASNGIHSAIKREGDQPPPLDAKVSGDPKVYPSVPAADFPLLTLPFDPTAKPNQKRENPKVLGIGLNAEAFKPEIKAYQVDLVRAPMRGYDIVFDSSADGKQVDPKIAVVTTKAAGTQNTQAVKDALRGISDRARAQSNNRAKRPAAAGPGQPGQPGAAGQLPPGSPMSPMGPMGGGLGQPGPLGGGPGGRPGMPGPGGKGGGYPGGYGGLGMPGMGGFEQNAQREDKVVEYIPLDALDDAQAKGKLPAMTVIPLRMVVVNAVFPLKDQVEEVRKAMRLRNLRDAAKVVQDFGFNGFNVRRRVIQPNGVIAGVPPRDDGSLVKLEDVVKNKEQNEQVGFFKYDYEAAYTEKIDSRKLADHVEGGSGAVAEAYLPYFYRYEDSLVMPFPELVAVGDGVQYPKVSLQPIADTINKLMTAKVAPQDPSDLLRRLQGKGGEAGEGGSRRGRFNPKSAEGTGAGTLFGGKASQQDLGGPGIGTGGKGPAGKGTFGRKQPDPKGKKDDKDADPVEIDHLLVRFIDCDVRPGFTYQYQIQIEMVNPNFGAPQTMANPALAGKGYEVLRGDYVMLEDALTVPDESFLFAADPVEYRQRINDEYKAQPRLRDRLQAREDQAAVQVMAWTEQVKTDSSGQREPVGAWVVADMPVGRGEYIGKKTFVPLPLWSSESNQYVLRELSAEKVVKGGASAQPKGWLVDFASKSVLVDFDGGRVKTRIRDRVVEDEVTAELLIARPDGSLQVRNAADDAADANRKKIEADWRKWVEDVKAARPAAGAAGANPFDRPGGGKTNNPGSGGD